VKFSLTHHAAEDLHEISRYTLSQWGEEQEDRYLRGLYSKLNEIAADPARWRFRNDLFPDCQVSRFGRHIILFICDGNVLTVVRILHRAMKIQNHIPDEF